MINNSEVLIFTDLGLELLSDYQEYNSKFSNKIYNNQQKIILLLIKQRFNLSYSQLVELIKISELILDKLKLKKIPDKSTLKKFAKRISSKNLSNFIGNSLKLLRKRNLEIGIDATGFQLQDGSFHYRKRIGLPSERRKFLKISSSIETRTQLVVSCEIHKNYRGDLRDFKQLLNRTKKYGRIEIVTADKGYDSEWAREFVIENIKAECQIPIKGKLGKHAGFYRKRFVKNERKYHQRSKTETVFSVIKRMFGEVVRAKKWLMQKKELLLRFLCYNLYRVARLKRVSP